MRNTRYTHTHAHSLGYEILIQAHMLPLYPTPQRWSQVLYMYYFLQFRAPLHTNRSHSRNAYILTTDADVGFTPADVKALTTILRRLPGLSRDCFFLFLPIGFHIVPCLCMQGPDRRRRVRPHSASRIRPSRLVCQGICSARTTHSLVVHSFSY